MGIWGFIFGREKKATSKAAVKSTGASVWVTHAEAMRRTKRSSPWLTQNVRKGNISRKGRHYKYLYLLSDVLKCSAECKRYKMKPRKTVPLKTAPTPTTGTSSYREKLDAALPIVPPPVPTIEELTTCGEGTCVPPQQVTA